LYLDPHPDISPSSRAWWERKLKAIMEEFENEHVARSILARSILAVEYFSYVSNKYRHGRLSLPSQQYSFDLVRNAVTRNAVIILTRGERRWLREIRELERYPYLVRLREVQRASISSGNCCGDGWSLILEVVRELKQRGPMPQPAGEPVESV
jgi:hypothetical protein